MTNTAACIHCGKIPDTSLGSMCSQAAMEYHRCKTSPEGWHIYEMDVPLELTLDCITINGVKIN
jgi:hypothetical protein